MKTLLSLIILIFITFSSYSQELNSPESVVFDSHNNRYLVSNASTGRSGGSIVSIDPVTQEITGFIESNLNSPKGLTIVDDVLYCTDMKCVKGFRLSDAKEVMNVFVPNSQFLNDITNDGLNLYVSDNAVSKIFKLNILSGNVSVLKTGKQLQKPNGLFFDKYNNRLLICSFRSHSPIQSYDLALNILSLVTETDLNQLDGLTCDGDGNYYVSSWGTNSVYRFDPDFENEAVEVSNGHYSPADIFYNIEDKVLVVPNFNFNTVDFISLENKDAKSNFNPYHLNIFPNPNDGLFTISFALEYESQVSIYIMNKSGKILHVIKKEITNTDTQEIKIDLSSFGISKGVYFIKLVFGDDVYMKRIVVID